MKLREVTWSAAVLKNTEEEEKEEEKVEEEEKEEEEEEKEKEKAEEKEEEEEICGKFVGGLRSGSFHPVDTPRDP